MNQAQKKLEEILQDGVKIGAYPGCNYCLIANGHTLFGSLGNKENYPTPTPNTIDTIYDMASLTKVVCTTTCVMQLVAAGKIRIYDNVKRYFEKFPHENITLFNLLTHTSGIPEGVPGNKAIMSKEDVWNKIYETKLLYEPGTKITYSDINYIILGEIVEQLSGKPLNVYAKENVFDPLEMVDTGFLPQDKSRCAATEYRDDDSYHGYVQGMVHDETAYALGCVAGHAGLFSTVKDLSHFLQMILDEGRYQDKIILPKIVVNELFEVKVKEYHGVETHPLARCYGWQTKDPFSSAGELVSDETILHTGFTGTNIFIDRKNHVAFALLSNRVNPTRKNLLHMRVRACAANYIMSHLEEF